MDMPELPARPSLVKLIPRHPAGIYEPDQASVVLAYVMVHENLGGLGDGRQ